MRSILLLCLFVWRGTSALPAEPSSIISPHQAQGPPIGRQNRDASTKSKLEPQPPSIEGIDIEFDLRTPAPPPLGSGPQPPSSPDPALLELFERNPSAFAALFNNIQKQNGIKMKRDIKNQQKQRRSPTYDQFLTAAVISGFDLRNRLYTMFAPEDGVFAQLNLSLPLLALKDKNCVAQIVRSHMVAGKIAIRDDNEQMAVSLQESPIFFTIKEANGAGVVRANVETDYGIVHIIDALIDRPTLMDVCPSLSHLKSDQSKGQLQHSINQRKVKDFDEFYLQESWNGNAISGLNDGPVHESVDRDVYEYSFAEDDVPLELLDSIDNFAHDVKMAWQAGKPAEDNVIAKLEHLDISIFLALLERSHLTDTLASHGHWTIFAPDNNAWQSLPQETFQHLTKNPELLKEILNYHIVKGNVTRGRFSDSHMLHSLHRNYPVYVDFYSDGVASWYTASGSQIVDLDETASNGVVHVVSSVLFPPSGDLYSTVQKTPALQMSFSLLQGAILPVLFNESAPVTAFLPVDSPQMEEILSSRTLTSLSSSALNRHVIRGTWFTSGLIDGDQIYNLDNQAAYVTHNRDCIGINGACIVARDITLTNGVLHVIDRPI